MGCCGCSLYASTVTAGILTLLDCVVFLTFDILVLVFIGANKHLISKDKTKFDRFVAGFADLDDHTTIIVLIGIKVGLRIAWLLSSILLLVGNAREYRKFLNVWKYLTVSRIIYTIGTSIFGLVHFMEDMKKLFNDNLWDSTKQSGPTYVAEFTILIDFIELGPIWLIILIALAIFVHQRSYEIDVKKTSNVNHWGNFGNSAGANGSARIPSNLTHTASLNRQPTPFTVATNNENNNTVPQITPQPQSSLKRDTVLQPMNGMKPTTSETLKPILEINGVISIPRVTLNQNKVKSSVQTYDNKTFDTTHENKKHISALAKRSSYLEYERDSNRVPKRNHSYNLAQNPVQRARHHSYDNRGFDYKTEDELKNKPVLIKRASVRRSQNQ